MKKKHRRCLALALIALLLVAPACKQTDGDFVPAGTPNSRQPNELDLAAESASILANGVDTTMLTATVFDAEGNLLPQITVQFTTPFGTIDRFAVTDSLGQASAVLTSAASEQDLDANVLAEVYSVPPTPGGFSALGAAPAFGSTAGLSIQVRDRASVTMRGITLTVFAEPDVIAADGVSSAAVTASITETTRGVPLENVTVSFGTSAGTITGSDLTDSSGLASSTLTSSTAPAVAEVRAFFGETISATTAVTFSEGVGE